MKKGKKNNEAPQGINTTYIDTRVDNETKKRNTQTTRLKKGSGHSTKYMHHKNKKTIKSQNRNTNTTELFTQAQRGFLFDRFRSTCVTNVGNSLRRRAISLDT